MFKKLAKQGASLRHQTHHVTGEAITVMGTTNVRVTYEGQDISLPLLVTEGNGPSLIGRNWLMNLKLNWKEIFVIKSEKTLEDILSQNAEVFGDELGTLKGVRAKQYVDSTATPRFHKAKSGNEVQSKPTLLRL